MGRLCETMQFIRTFNLRQFIGKIARKHNTMFLIARRFDYFIWLGELVIVGLFIRKTGKATNITWLHLNRLKYVTHSPVKIIHRAYFGRCLGGNWDLDKSFLSEVDLEDRDMFNSFKQRFINGKTWEQTYFYEKALGQLKNGICIEKCKHPKQLKMRLIDLDNLFENIKVNGYKSQCELGTYRTYDEINVCIDRNGEVLFSTGIHRLIIAKLLNLRLVPVAISIRHNEWCNYKRYLKGIIDEYYDGKAHHPIYHPDFQDMPSHVGEDVFYLIIENIQISKGTVLDLSAHWGYFCHKFEENGFTCVANEIQYDNNDILKKLRNSVYSTFSISNSSLKDIILTQSQDYDIILAFDILYKYYKDKQKIGDLKYFLQNINSKYLFWCDCQLDIRSVETFLYYLIDNSKYDSFKCIGYYNKDKNIPLFMVS